MLRWLKEHKARIAREIQAAEEREARITRYAEGFIASTKPNPDGTFSYEGIKWAAEQIKGYSFPPYNIGHSRVIPRGEPGHEIEYGWGPGAKAALAERGIDVEEYHVGAVRAYNQLVRANRIILDREIYKEKGLDVSSLPNVPKGFEYMQGKSRLLAAIEHGLFSYPQHPGPRRGMVL